MPVPKKSPNFHPNRNQHRKNHYWRQPALPPGAVAEAALAEAKQRCRPRPGCL
jgi:hypothetical protein